MIKNDSFLDKAHSKFRDIIPDGDIPSMCQCSRHLGSVNVDWKECKPEMELYFEIGDFKG